MVRDPQISLRSKYKLILESERSWSYSVIRNMTEIKPLTVWEIVIPIIFIFRYAKSKTEREVFSKNLLFTKELALKAAFRMINESKTRDEVMLQIEKKTNDVLASENRGIYSEAIRQEQLKEMGLLIGHYTRLLSAVGTDYPSLVMDAYQNKENYRAFIEELFKAEKNVNETSLKSLGTRGDPETVTKIERASEKTRISEVNTIF